MNASSGLIEAIERVRLRVRAKGRLHRTKTPAALLQVLFKRLVDAVQSGGAVGMPLELADARKALRTQEEYDEPAELETVWKTAVTSIAEALNRVRDPAAPLPAYVESGLACIRTPIDHVDTFVVVEGPRLDGDSCLQLRVRTIPGEQLKSEPPSNSMAHVLSLPALVEERLKRIAEQVAHVLDDCDHDQRRCDLITQHVLMVVKGLEDAALELGLGEIYTEYNDFALLSAQVEAMRSGDELLGLTEWETDWQWWESDEGRRFREANEMAIAQGGVIRRIFLHATPERATLRNRRRREMKMHRDMGVEVGAISLQQVRKFRPAAMSVRSRCVLWSSEDGEGWLTYSVETSADGRPSRNRFSVHLEDVKENRSLLEEIWNHAHE